MQQQQPLFLLCTTKQFLALIGARVINQLVIDD